MKMTRILAALTVAALASAPAMAAFEGNFWKYVWAGDAGDGSYSNTNNWDTVQNEGELARTEGGTPGERDWAYIGYDVSVVNGVTVFTPNTNSISVSMGNALNTKQLYLGHATTFTFNPNNANFSPEYVYLSGGAELVFTTTNAIGFGKNFTVDYGTFTADSHGTLTATEIAGFWTNGKTITFAGTLDLSGLTGEGEIVLANYKTAQAGGNLVLNLDGLTYTGIEGAAVSFTTLADGSNTKLVANYSIPEPTPAVPEPTTATLSLLALAGLAARRRRK